MKNDSVELPIMSSTMLCQECCSVHTHKIKSSPISSWCLMAVGYQLLECKSCNHRWKEFFPMELLLNLVYLLLAVEIIILAMNSFNV